MKRGAPLVGFSRDPLLRQRLNGYLNSEGIIWAEDLDSVYLALEQRSACVLLLDLRQPRLDEFLSRLQEVSPNCATICFGEANSRPALSAHQYGTLAIHPLECDRHALVSSIVHAAELSVLRADARIPRAALFQTTAGPKAAGLDRSSGAISAVSRAFACLEDEDALLHHIVQAVATNFVSSRTGLYVLSETEDTYVLRAGVRSLPTDHRRGINKDDPFVRWAKLRGELVSRAHLDLIPEADQRALLLRMLDECGAEVLAPLLTEGGLLGWLAIGRPAGAQGFTQEQLENLLVISQEVTVPLKKAFGYRRSDLRRQLLERLFDSIPTGLVAVNESGEILWLNRASENLLGVQLDLAVGQPVEVLGSKVAQFVRSDGMNGQNFAVHSHESLHLGLSVEVLATPTGEQQGTLLLVQDLTDIKAAGHIRHRAIKAELAAGMAENLSFQFRGPLSVIKAYAQLVPENVEDAETLRRYGSKISMEVERLSSLSNSLHQFFHQDESDGSSTSTFTVEHLLSLVRCLSGSHHESISVSTSGNLPAITGNPARFAECLCHLLSNAREAAVIASQISLRVSRNRVSQTLETLQFEIADNRTSKGTGAFLDQSNLQTADARQRADLRMMFACEIVREFSGDISLRTTPTETIVTIQLPIEVNEA